MDELEQRSRHSSCDDKSEKRVASADSVSNPVDEIERADTCSKNVHCRGSSLTMSPQVPTQVGNKDSIDNSSLTLLNSASFDHSMSGDISEILALRSDDGVYTPTSKNHLENGSSSSAMDNAAYIKGVTINTATFSIPKLCRNESSTQHSVGDISPIKVEYPDGTEAREEKSDHDRTSHIFSYGHQGNTQASSLKKTHNNRNPHSFESRSNPYFVLRQSQKVFEHLKYHLPCMDSKESCSVQVSEYGNNRHYEQKQGMSINEPSLDFLIASQRVDAAICAFGGTVNRNPQSWSIFRLKGTQSESRHQYEHMLPTRYKLSESGISWDVEENPPIHPFSEQSEKFCNIPGTKMNSLSQADEDVPSCFSTMGNHLESDHIAKMKYRCKVCGELKQNHVCRFQQSLQRSIGVMVYPAANSYTAAEPGVVAPPLSKMNNFISYDSEQGSPSTVHDSRQGTDAVSVVDKRKQPSAITPDTLRGVPVLNSPLSSMSTASSDDTDIIASPAGRSVDATGKPVSRKRAATCSGERIAARAHRFAQRSPFVASVNLRMEHYRTVTPLAKHTKSVDAGQPKSRLYQYPAVPLTFRERKRLSDTLFYLSQQMPEMTSLCAATLVRAREENNWDLAVAEILSQIIVCLYCGEGDDCLDGLQQYLLALGISV